MKVPPPTQLKLLLAIPNAGIPAKTLRRHFHQTPHGTFYTSVRRLNKSGWIETLYGVDDKRTRLYMLTKQAKSKMKHLKALKG